MGQMLQKIQMEDHFGEICGRMEYIASAQSLRTPRCERQVNMESPGLSHLNMVKCAGYMVVNYHLEDVAV